ncbi:UrcA family protein [Sphingomonas sp. 1P08PE]|uniref:UrcA family protein n=1 Tax=Sphingomonas sp. 1P08PE TaxID=554122 RepID=UPI00399F135D
MLKVAGAALAACLITPALCAAPVANPLVKSSTVLKLDGLDLATPQGQRVLAIRMNQAARDVCGSGLETIHLAAGAQSRTCQSDVKADIRSRIEQRTAGTAPASVMLAAR